MNLWSESELAAWRAASEGVSWHGSGAWRDGYLSADFVVDRIAAGCENDANLTADVGQNQMWVARYGGFRRANSHLASGGLGTMGFALPAAMGAAVALPEKRAWAIAGDGGFQMTLQELATIAQERIPVKIALLQINPTVGDLAGNARLIADAARRAGAQASARSAPRAATAAPGRRRTARFVPLSKGTSSRT